MSPRMNLLYRLALSAAVFCLLSAGFSSSISGQEPSRSITVGNVKLVGVPEDWTHHHAIFSDPGTEADALKNGTYSEWTSIVNDPRYVLQQLKRRHPAQGPAAEDVARLEEQFRTTEAARAEELAAEAVASPAWRRIVGRLTPPIKNDWSMILGPSATVGAGNYPAKFSFIPTATPNCGNTATPDFVVYNTSVAASATQASIVAYDNLYSSCPATTQTIPSVYWAFNTGGTVKTSPVLSLTGSQVIFVQTPASGSAQLVLLSWAATPSGRSVTGKVTNGSKIFSVSAGTLTSMDVGAVMTGTGIPLGDTIATVTGAGAGTLVANATITTGVSGEALAISADAGGPDTPSAVAAGSYSGCATPCMTTLTFAGSGTRADNFSSPYYDYSHDTLYVGDASGGLHKFHPVLNGTPAEIGSPWASLGTTAVTSPVYDETTGDVYAGDASGFLYSVNAAGTVVKSVQVANSPGIVDSPLVDLSAGQIYAFVPQDFNSTNSTTSPCGNINSNQKTICNGVVQLPAAFTAATDFTESVFGVGTTNTLYIGTFDNSYETSGTGNIYATGATGANDPKLMETPVNASGFNGVACQSGTGLPTGGSAIQCSTSIVTLTTASAPGAPVIEILNGATDRIFTGVAALSATAAGCATGNGCISSWTSTTTIASGTNASAGLILAGGPSGIIIDNTSSVVGGASQVYCGTLGTGGNCSTSGTLTTGGCAVQANQNGL